MYIVGWIYTPNPYTACMAWVSIPYIFRQWILDNQPNWACNWLHFTSRLGQSWSSGHQKKWLSQCISIYTMWGPQSIAQFLNITPISLWSMVLITIVNGVYKPTNITGGPHIVSISMVDDGGWSLLSRCSWLHQIPSTPYFGRLVSVVCYHKWQSSTKITWYDSYHC